MGWFGDLMEDLDRPANAIQGYFVGGMRDDETRFEGLKRGWNQEENYDFEQIWSEDLAKQKGYYERDNWGRTSYAVSAALNLLVDPLNLLGGGMFTKGVKGVEKATKAGADVNPKAMKGFMASSVPNYIEGFYGKSDRTVDIVKSMQDGMLVDSIKYTTPYQKQILYQVDDVIRKPESVKAYEKAKGYTGKAKTATYGVTNMMSNVLSPHARALYRSEGINKGLMESAFISNKNSKEIELVHRALANAHILEQSGRVGGKQIVSDFNKFLGVQGYQPYKKGQYAQLTKGMTAGIGDDLTKKEYKYIEDHIGSVWKGSDDVSIKDAKNTKVFIKRGGFEDRGYGMNRSGRHYEDVLGGRDARFNAIQKTVLESSPKNLKELKKILDEADYRGKDKPTLKVDEESGNVWASYSFPGSSITEGGINVVMGVKPNGKFVFSISDEHDFLEKGVKWIPGSKAAMKKLLPNRLLAVTPPFSGHLSMPKGSKTLTQSSDEILKRNVKDQDKFNWTEQLTELTTAVPKSADLAYEKARQQRSIGLGLMAIPQGTNE